MKQLNLSAGSWMRLLTLFVFVASAHVLSAQDQNPCDDGNPATIDYIDDEGRCHHIYNLCCDDGDPATIDRINPETGECENIPNPSLLDCDGDGVADQDEDDCNENGVPDDCEQLDDCNENGVPDECENLRDFNNNGIPDECEDCNENGIPDYRDNATDCNRNGIPDECENLRDCNGNGWPDICEPLQDCNNNGYPDECEDLPDCDGNGITDICQDDFADCNGNGIMDKCESTEDCNNNGIPDACEPDTDKDGIIDDCDVEECDGIDNDGDGFTDEGFDADNDGIKDCFDVEICNGKDDDGDGEIDEGFPDTDGDGIPDCRDNCPDTPNADQADTDGDMMGDACDACNDKQDADGDMVPDCRDNCINTPNPDQTDSDGDGVGDACDNCVETSNPGQENADGDEYGDACDTCPDDAANKCNDCINVIDGGAIKGNQTGCGEFDPDAIMSTRDPAFQQGESAEIEYLWMKSTVNVPFDPTDPNTPWEMIPGSDDASYDPGVITQTTYFQRCARGVNCDDYVGESNVVVITITPCEVCDGVDNDGDGQIDEGYPDTDKDGVADCADDCDDRDDDNDGIPNCEDICLLGDDNADADGDGVPDACDTCPFESNPGAEQDVDDDNDGIPNACDNCAQIGNGPQMDTDQDGIGDACDSCAEGDDNADADGDGIPDACDTEVCDNVDNDGDGLVDEGLTCDGNCSVSNPMQNCDVATIQYIVSSNDDCGDPTELVIPVPECVSLGDVSVMGEYSSVAMGDSDCAFYPGESAIVITLDHGDGAPYIVEVSIEGTSYESGNGTIGTTDGDRCSFTDNMPQFVCFDYTDVDSDNDGTIDECDQEECDGIDNDGDGQVDEGFMDTDGDGIADCVDTEECDGIDNDGDGQVDEGFMDTDGDGIADCVDTEECDGIDNDGDGQVDEGFMDTDGDGIADCVDTEECDGIDNDGDGDIDEGLNCDSDCVATSTSEDCDEATITYTLTKTDQCGDPSHFVINLPGDCDITMDDITVTGEADEVSMTDSPCDFFADGVKTLKIDIDQSEGDEEYVISVTIKGTSIAAGAGTVGVKGGLTCTTTNGLPGFACYDYDANDSDNDGTPDCDDTEECDGIDNDGDGLIDEGFDSDNDGTADCFDTEICDGLDNDGDGEIDEDLADPSLTLEKDCEESDPPCSLDPELLVPYTGNDDQVRLTFMNRIVDEQNNVLGYKFRIRNGTNSALQNVSVKKPGTTIYTRSSIPAKTELFFIQSTPIAGVSVHWDGGSKGTASTNETKSKVACGYYVDSECDLTCENTSITLVATATNVYYEWFKDDVKLNGEDGSTLVVTMPGIYKVFVTDKTTACTNYETIEVVETPCVEICDGIDNDGDGLIDEGFADEDNDNIGDECDDCVNFKPGDDGGHIDENQTICEGETPAKITSSSLPSGHGQGAIEYIWLKYEGENAPPNIVGNDDWMTIEGATGTMYQPGELTTTTWFIRCARREGCETYWAETNKVKVTVEECCVNFEPGDDGGDIEDDQMICEGETPAKITSSSLPSGHGQGAIEYIWLKYEGETAEPNIVGNDDWMTIEGATGTMYQPGELTTTTWFIRCARREGCETYWAETNKVKVTVEECCVNFEPGDDGGDIEDDQMICEGETPAKITSSSLPSGHGQGAIEYIWLKYEGETAEPNIVGNDDWMTIEGATGTMYQPGELTTTTWFIRCARREGCETYWAETNKVKVTVEECDGSLDPASQRAGQGLNRANANQMEQGTNVSLPKVGIWPNPTVGGHLNLDLSDYAGENAFVQIYDMSGTLVYSNEFREITSETYQIMIEDLDSGLYKLRTIVKGQPMTHSTFVVQNK